MPRLYCSNLTIPDQLPRERPEGKIRSGGENERSRGLEEGVVFSDAGSGIPGQRKEG